MLMPPAQTLPHTCLCDVPIWVPKDPSHTTCLGETHHNVPLPTQASSSFLSQQMPPTPNQPSDAASQNLGVFLAISHLSISVSNPSAGLIDFTSQRKLNPTIFLHLHCHPLNPSYLLPYSPSSIYSILTKLPTLTTASYHQFILSQT